MNWWYFQTNARLDVGEIFINKFMSETLLNGRDNTGLKGIFTFFI